ncbi:MAG: LysM peptidoglycan-binding domain-containing protein [Anaerolineales bacterium]|nr:LysM peptidoglycan-binding domain-containing protein [Anaerolineales bacterium]
MKKNTLAVITLALLLVALIAGCKRAKPAVVSDVQVVSTTAATVATGRTVVPATSPSPTSEITPETTPMPSPEVATPTPHSEATTAPTAAPTSTPVPTTASTAAPTTAPTAAPTKAPSGGTTHVVQPGENLFRIALHYEMSYESVAAANGIVNPNLIHVGQRLTIPTGGTAPTTSARTHVVQPGENLFRIALRYGVTVEALAVANDISNISLIHTGQQLRIP